MSKYNNINKKTHVETFPKNTKIKKTLVCVVSTGVQTENPYTEINCNEDKRSIQAMEIKIKERKELYYYNLLNE
jgi:hypothetical protein